MCLTGASKVPWRCFEGALKASDNHQKCYCRFLQAVSFFWAAVSVFWAAVSLTLAAASAFLAALSTFVDAVIELLSCCIGFVGSSFRF